MDGVHQSQDVKHTSSPRSGHTRSGQQYLTTTETEDEAHDLALARQQVDCAKFDFKDVLCLYRFQAKVDGREPARSSSQHLKLAIITECRTRIAEADLMYIKFFNYFAPHVYPPQLQVLVATRGEHKADMDAIVQRVGDGYFSAYYDSPTRFAMRDISLRMKMRRYNDEKPQTWILPMAGLPVNWMLRTFHNKPLDTTSVEVALVHFPTHIREFFRMAGIDLNSAYFEFELIQAGARWTHDRLSLLDMGTALFVDTFLR